MLDTQITDMTRWCKHFLLSGVTLSKSTTLASEYPVLEMQSTTPLENQTMYIKAKVTNEKTSKLTSRSWNATTSIQDLTINDWWCFGGLQGNENLEQLLNFIFWKKFKHKGLMPLRLETLKPWHGKDCRYWVIGCHESWPKC